MTQNIIFKYLLGPACLVLMAWITPTELSAAPYYEFYQSAYNKCAQAAEAQGLLDDCPQATAACLEELMKCAQEKSNCSLQTGSDGLFLACEEGSPSPYEACINPVLDPLIISFVEQGLCDTPFEAGALDMSQPGCGNKVKELGETCDDGNTLDGDACPYNCVDPKALCGNGTLDPGEACDAGGENGKVASGCDIECKKFPTGDPVTTAEGPDLTTDQLNTSQPATGSCSLTSLAGSSHASNLIFYLLGLFPLLLQARRFNG